MEYIVLEERADIPLELCDSPLDSEYLLNTVPDVCLELGPLLTLTEVEWTQQISARKLGSDPPGFEFACCSGEIPLFSPSQGFPRDG
jgi:hypothetical protein